ncbi:hypothetical protein ACHAWF_006538 [Thalassiosira exigua]
MGLHSRVDGVVDLPTTLSSGRRDKEDWRPPNLRQLLPKVLHRLIVSAGILVDDGVPLVANDDAGAAVVGDLLRQHTILLRHTRRGVQHQEDHIGATDGPQRAIDHEEFRSKLHLSFAADACGVNEAVYCGQAVRVRCWWGALHDCIDRITGCPCNIADDGTVGTKYCVEKGRLSNVWTSHNRHIYLILNES